MSYQPLHHKYRPQTFADLVGQAAIATTLTHALQQQRIAPAYLFTGARGTGKTSSARILAKSLNCLKFDKPTEKPCGQCEVCRAIANGSALDVIEIDAASNTGVDNIRELIERAQFAPVQCRYKVYVVDECHMLSTAAFNALLKTLEEPPDRVVFVLATTDPQRVLPTIISRCQRFDFRRIPLDAMVTHLRAIATKEQIAITNDALTLVAQLSQGGLRDAESTLDQLGLLAGEVTVERVWDLVGSVPERDLLSLLDAIAADNPEALLDSTRQLMDRGREPLIVLQNLASFYRDLLIAKTAPNRADLVALTAPTWDALCQFAQSLDVTTILEGQKQLRSAEAQLKSTTQPRLWLEITLMGLLPSAIASTTTASYQRVTNVQVKVSQPSANGKTTTEERSSPQPGLYQTADPRPTTAPGSPEPKIAPLPVETAPQEQVEAIAIEVTATEASNSNLAQIWQQIIAHLHPLSKALLNEHGQLLNFDGQEALIGIGSDKLVKIAQGKMKDIEKAFEEVFQQKVRVSLEVAVLGMARQTTPPAQTAPPDRLQPTPVNPSEVDRSSPKPARSRTPASPNAVDQPSPPSPITSTASTNDWEEDVAARAARQLAEFFGGKVVNLDDAPVSSPEAAIELEPPTEPVSLNESDDTDDVPF